MVTSVVQMVRTGSTCMGSLLRIEHDVDVPGMLPALPPLRIAGKLRIALAPDLPAVLRSAGVLRLREGDDLLIRPSLRNANLHVERTKEQNFRLALVCNFCHVIVS